MRAQHFVTTTNYVQQLCTIMYNKVPLIWLTFLVFEHTAHNETNKSCNEKTAHDGNDEEKENKHQNIPKRTHANSAHWYIDTTFYYTVFYMP